MLPLWGGKDKFHNEHLLMYNKNCHIQKEPSLKEISNFINGYHNECNV